MPGPLAPGDWRALHLSAERIASRFSAQGRTVVVDEDVRFGVGKDGPIWAVYGGDVPGTPGVPEVICEHRSWEGALRCAIWHHDHRIDKTEGPR